MRYTFYLLVSLVLSLLPFLLIAQEKVLNQKNLQIRNGLYFKVNTRSPFTGEAFYEKYDNGQWKYLNYFEEGKIISTEAFYENGQIEFTEVSENDKREAQYFHSNGVLKHKNSYFKSDPTGIWQWFDRGGSIIREEEYKNLEGKHRILDEDQQILFEINYLDGLRHGKFYRYNDGQIVYEVEYLGGKANGISKRFSFLDSNQLWEIGRLKNDKRDGLYISYNFEGDLREVGRYKDGKKIDLWVRWYIRDFDTNILPISVIEKYLSGKIIERECLDEKEKSCEKYSSDVKGLKKKYEKQIDSYLFLYGDRPSKDLVEELLSMVDEEGNIVSNNKIIKMKKVKEEENAQEIAHKAKLKEKMDKAEEELKQAIYKKISRNWNIGPLMGIQNLEKYKVIIEIKINSEGQLSAPLRVIHPDKPKGSESIAKRLAVNAILASIPFSISKEIFPDGITMKMFFDPAAMTENGE